MILVKVKRHTWVHFDVIFPLTKKLRGWSQKVILVKVKRHAGCFLNEMADERAEEGRLSDAVPICLGQNKYGSLQLRIKASLRAQVAEDKVNAPLPREEAPDKQISCQTIRVNLSRAPDFRNIMLAQDVLVQQHVAVVHGITSSCLDSVVSYWMKAMTQTLPVATHVHRINPTKHSPCCIHCSYDGSQKENLPHFLSICPKLHHGRTAALATSLRKHLAAPSY